jgi:hypothetical protein
MRYVAIAIIADGMKVKFSLGALMNQRSISSSKNMYQEKQRIEIISSLPSTSTNSVI